MSPSGPGGPRTRRTGEDWKPCDERGTCDCVPSESQGGLGVAAVLRGAVMRRLGIQHYASPLAPSSPASRLGGRDRERRGPVPDDEGVGSGDPGGAGPAGGDGGGGTGAGPRRQEPRGGHALAGGGAGGRRTPQRFTGN